MLVHGPASTARQMLFTTGCLRRMRSVVCVDTVQARRTELPMRTAERFSTARGRLRLGGWGAPGAPHPAKILTAKSARAKTKSLMLSQRKSSLCRCQNRAQSCFQFRIFENEPGRVQASRHYPHTRENGGISHFSESQPQRKRGSRQNGRAMKNTAQHAGELQVGDR